MKILRLIYEWPPPWQGLTPHPYELTVAQALRGDIIHVFCGRWPNAGPVEQPDGVYIHPIWREPVPYSIFFTSSIVLLIKYLLFRRNKKEAVDVIHSHGHFGIWVYLYRLILKKYFPWSDELLTPFVVHFHNTSAGRRNALEGSNQVVKSESKSFGWPMMEFSDKLAVKVADACVFVSEETKQEAIKFYNVSPEKCFVVESGVNSELFTPVGVVERDKSRRDLGLDSYDKVILYHGVLVQRKNPHLLIEALSHLSVAYKLLIVGSGDQDYTNQLMEMIKTMNLESRVIRVGYTPYPNAPISYQVSDIFVLPSQWEGLPKAVMQGLSCGIPCLVSGFKLSEEISGLFYLADMSPEGIAQRIVEIVEHPGAIDTSKVSGMYSWGKRVKELDKAYDYAQKHVI